MMATPQRRVGYLFPSLAFLLLTALPVRSEDKLPPSILSEATIQQSPGAQVRLDTSLRDETGKSVLLRDYFNGKPVILVLAYYRCPSLCNQVLNGLVEGLRPLNLEPGKDFQVVVVSFDGRDTPRIAAAKKANYVQSYGRPGAEAGLHFLTGEDHQVFRLAQSVGFHYAYDTRTDQFAHASGIMILTPTGRVARYFLGINYGSFDLRLALVEASASKIGTVVDAVLLRCYQYDGNTGRYTPAVMGFIQMGGALTILVLGGFIGTMLLRDRWKARVAVASAVRSA
jgi:protein SCO1/2